MRSQATALLALALLLAGCATPPTATTTTGTTTTGLPASALPNATAAPELPARLEYEGCRQLHTFFPFPLAAFDGVPVPEGFALSSADSAGATTNVFIVWWFCQDGQLNHTLVPRFGETGSMLIALPVTPPSSLANASVDLDLVGLVWLVSSTTAARYLANLDGLDDFVEGGDVAQTGRGDLGVLVTDSGSAAPSFGTFGIDTAVQAAPGDNPLSLYRIWQSVDGKAVGHLEVANQPGQSIGAGAAALRFAGDFLGTGAPPFAPGEAHVADGVTVHLVPRPLPQA